MGNSRSQNRDLGHSDGEFLNKDSKLAPLRGISKSASQRVFLLGLLIIPDMGCPVCGAWRFPGLKIETSTPRTKTCPRGPRTLGHPFYDGTLRFGPLLCPPTGSGPLAAAWLTCRSRRFPPDAERGRMRRLLTKPEAGCLCPRERSEPR